MMKGVVLSFLVLFFALHNEGTEINLNFGGMLPSNSFSCNTSDCPPSQVQQLDSSLTGDVYTLDSDPDLYDRLIETWTIPRSNRYIPTIVVLPETEEDVVTAVNFAREQGIEISIKNGGHSLDGLSLTQRGLQLNFERMNHVVLDVDKKLALVEPGAQNKDINILGRHYNLAHIGGNVGELGFSGQTSVGGYGSLSRMYGLGVDNVVSVRLVTWQGTVMNVSKTSNPDLFFAVRGALSNYGIAILWEVRIHDVTWWYGGDIVYPPSAISAVLQWANQYSYDEYFHFRGLYIPQEEVFVTQWAFWNPGFSTQEKDAFFEPLEIVAPFYAWTLGTEDYYENQESRDAKTTSAPRSVFRGYGTGGGVVQPSVDFFDKFQELCIGLEMEYGECRFEMWGGNISRVYRESTAFWSRNSEYLWTFQPSWLDSAQDQVWPEKALNAYETLRQFPEATSDCYPNYVSPDFAERCYGENIVRLRELKKEYDPNNFFHRNYNIQ